MTPEGIRDLLAGGGCSAMLIYYISLPWLRSLIGPAEFIIGQSQGDITAVINIQITRSTKRQNTNVIIFSYDKNIYIESETSTVDMITKKTILIG